MSFYVKKIGTDQTKIWTSKELKQQIINGTKSKFIGANVRQEGTGLRPTAMDAVINSLKEDITVLKRVFIVSALFRYNKDPKTRYLILVDGDLSESEERTLLQIVKANVPIWSVTTADEVTDQNAEHSYLSEWFRSTMGNGFSFIDIDYLIYKEGTNSVLLMEEKSTGSYSIGYGQLLSYEELLKDVINIPAKVMFLYVLGSTYRYFVCNRAMIANENRNQFFKSNYPGFIIRQSEINEFEDLEALIQYVNMFYVEEKGSRDIYY